MGTCYSCQARISKPTYPSDMSLSSNSSTKKGPKLRGPGTEAFGQQQNVKTSRLRPPSVKLTNSRTGSNTSIDRLDTSNESGIVLSVDSTKTKKRLPQYGGQTKTDTGGGGTGLPKFGFGQKSPRASKAQRSDANKNLMDVSSDSLDSIDSKKSSNNSTKPQRRNLNDNARKAFDPKAGAGWRMIDDSESTTTDSKSVSTHGKSEHEPERDPNGNALNNPPLRLRGPEKQGLNGNSLKVQNPSKTKRTSRLKAPGSKQTDRQWVKAGQVEMEENFNSEDKPARAPVETNAPVKRRMFFSRGRGKLQFGSDRGSSDKSKTDQATFEKVANDSTVEDEISRTVQTMLDASPDPKDVKDKINVLSKDMSKLSVSDPKQEDLQVDGEMDSDQEDCPLARLDSLDTCSLSSLNSDDMMLETDLPDDVYNQSTTSMDASYGAGSLPRQKAPNRDVLSLSQPASGLAKLDKRPFTRRNPPEGGWRQGSLKGPDGTRERRARTQSATSEAVAELSGMIGTGASGPPSIQRRPPKFSRERPASFPGPLSADGKPPGGDSKAIQFRQRGKSISIGDEEQVVVDATTFRFMMQELTDCKTMIFKLKRVIQEEEIGSPFGNTTLAGTLKNGYKLGSGGSTPQSPLVSSDGVGSFSYLDQGESKKMQEVMQENADLHAQLASLRRQMDEQDRTIKLLQQQMTKYECGHIGPEGKVYSSATTQTEKPRMTVPKSVLRPSAGGQPSSAGGASPGSDAPISSRRIPEPKDVTEPAGAGASGERNNPAKSQLPTSGVSRGQRSAGSRLPSMRIQRVSKGQTKLQSFSKIVPPQQANVNY